MVLFALIPQLGKAECLSLKEGPMVFDATGCKKLVPEELFNMSNSKYSWINDLDKVGRKKLLDSYRGLLLKGQVVKSKIKDKGLSTNRGALEGEEIFIYMPPSANACNNVLGLRLNGKLKEKCCDGNGDVPCLLNTTYLFNSVSAVGKAGSEAGDSTRGKAKRSKNVKLGDKEYAKKRYAKAIPFYEKARANGSLDVKGHYKLAHSYREQDVCARAVGPLEHIADMVARKKIWGDEEPIARKARFLQARCYAKMNKPQQAYLILSSYLLEPSKYRRELKQSLNHKDFGWIHTSKEYRLYKKDALKKLR